MKAAPSTPRRNSTQSAIRGLLDEPKINAMFASLSDQTLEDTIKISMASHVRASESGRNLDEKKTLASLMPKELRDALAEKFKINIDTDAARITIGEEIFSRLMKYITNNPQRLTMGIYDTLVEHKNFHHIVSLVEKKKSADGTMILVPTKTGITQGRATEVEYGINLQNILYAKVKMVLDSITQKDLKTANLGAKTKAFRDLLAGNHMMRLDFTPDEAMESMVKETSVSEDGKTITERTQRYVAKSSQTWNSK